MTKSVEVSVRYEEVSLQTALQFFADNNFKAPDGMKFLESFNGSKHVDWFVDYAEGRVLFRVYLKPSREDSAVKFRERDGVFDDYTGPNADGK